MEDKNKQELTLLDFATKMMINHVYTKEEMEQMFGPNWFDAWNKLVVRGTVNTANDQSFVVNSLFESNIF